MINLSELIKKYYRYLLISTLLIYITFSFIASYVLYDYFTNSALATVSLGDSIFKKIRIDIEKKVTSSREIFSFVEENYKKNVLRTAEEINAYIKQNYLEQYDVAIISNKKVIFDTTNSKEKYLDLNTCPDCLVTFKEAKNSGELLVDYPVLNSDNKTIYLYLLKYIPEKDLYLQLGYKLSVFSDMLDSMKFIGKGSNNLDYSVYHIYLDKYFVNTRLYGNIEAIDKTTIQNLMDNPQKMKIYRKFNEINLLGVIVKNRSFSLIYNLVAKPFTNAFLISWIIFNISLFMIFYLIYLKLTKIFKRKIENPLNQIKNYMEESKPYQYTGDIIEFRELSESYQYHLEKIKTRDFIREIIEVQENERDRIARDIHDNVIQDLNYILIRLQQKNESELAEILKNQIQVLRRMVLDEDKLLLINLGLKGYLEYFIRECTVKHPAIKFILKNDFNKFDTIGKDNQIHIMRIVKELLVNAIKHSKGTIILMSLRKKDNFLLISVEDNGLGFEIDNIDIKTHFGITSVRERVFLLGGTIDITSSQDGTKVFIQIPI